MPGLTTLNAILAAAATGQERRDARTRFAKAHIMKRLLAWVQAHDPDIAGLDRSRPLPPQFDCLTDDQMRAAFRSMDPWAMTDEHNVRPLTASLPRL